MDYREPWYDDDADRQYLPIDVQKLHFSHEESAHTQTTNMKELDNLVDRATTAFHKHNKEMWWKAYKDKLKGTYFKGKYDTLINRDDDTKNKKDDYGDYDRHSVDDESDSKTLAGGM
jgi:hypothetical protein